jgi:hypothetical protein
MRDFVLRQQYLLESFNTLFDVNAVSEGDLEKK